MTACKSYGLAASCIAILPSEECLAVLRGTDVAFEFMLTDADCRPVDLTADAVQLTILDKWGGTQLLQKVNNPGEHSDDLNGRTIFRILKTDFSAISGTTVVSGVYEVRRIHPAPSGEEMVHLQGVFAVCPPIGG